jgi:hypothetical protein
LAEGPGTGVAVVLWPGGVDRLDSEAGREPVEPPATEVVRPEGLWPGFDDEARVDDERCVDGPVETG